jgi:hypothetical protein
VCIILPAAVAVLVMHEMPVMVVLVDMAVAVPEDGMGHLPTVQPIPVVAVAEALVAVTVHKHQAQAVQV